MAAACSNRSPTLTSALFFFVFLLTALPLRAQSDEEYRRWLNGRAERLMDAARQQKDITEIGSERSARVREELEIQRDIEKREKTYSYAEPVLSPDGKPIAAMVNDAFMTVEELNARIRAAMRGMDAIEHPDPKERLRLSEDRVLAIAHQLINDWVMNTMLALQGKSMGFEATEGEIDEAIAEFRQAQAEMLGDGERSPAAMIGISQTQMRNEVRNSLIIEKYIRELMKVQFTEQDYQRIYNLDPKSFLIPARVRAFHVFFPMPISRDVDTLKETEKAVKKIRKKLRRSDAEEMAEIVRSADGQSWSAGDMGWVTSDSQTMPAIVMQALFTTEVGKATDVVQSRDGFHVLKILEREEGSPPGIEHARPQIENFLFTKSKYATYEALKSLYDIRYNTGGIKHWKRVTLEEMEQRNRRRARRPDLEDGITITELRRDIEGQPTVRSGGEGRGASPGALSRDEPAAPTIDLSVLQ